VEGAKLVISYPNRLPIVPFRFPVEGEVILPGSKSLTNRALLAAALSTESVTLRGALFSEDTQIMQDALQALGLTVSADPIKRTLTVRGGGPLPARDRATLFVGNAGTAARFLTAFLALHPKGEYSLDGVPAMRKRPMRGLLQALEEQGCTFSFAGEPGCFPFTMKTAGLRGGSLEVDARASSQILSALLLVAPLAQRPLSLKLKGATVSEPFLAMTLGLMEQFGIPTPPIHPVSSWKFPEGGLTLAPGRYRGTGSGVYEIEPDATAASYFAMLPRLVGGTVRLPGLLEERGLQGDVLFLSLLRQIEREAPEKTKRLPHYSGDYNAFSDTFLTAAAASALGSEPTCIRGIGHTRKQETDRIHAMATELKRIGQKIEETEDSLTIFPDRKALMDCAREGVVIETYHDHRVAMSFGILGSFDLLGTGDPWITIDNPGCCAKTYPEFFQVLEKLRLDRDRTD
jgi:3-phosphoshikimate 1-carboxyvinyltransferase